MPTPWFRTWCGHAWQPSWPEWGAAVNPQEPAPAKSYTATWRHHGRLHLQPGSQRVDAHFGWAKNIAIYDVSPEGYRFIEAVQFDGNPQPNGNEDKLAPKLAAIRDCAILYVAAIGGSGAARVVASNIHPLQVSRPEAITELLDKLTVVLKGFPPPWWRKALLKGRDRTLDFEDNMNLA